MPDGMDFGSAPYEQSSPTMLARQPVRQPSWNDRSANWWDLAYPALESRLTSLREWRWSWWWGWADLAAYNRPDRYKFFITPNNMTRGRPLNDQIIDSTALAAVNICAAGMWNGLVDPARRWMKLGLEPSFGDPDQETAEWLEHATDRLYAMFERSNFYNVMAQAFMDVAVFGTAPVIVYEDAIDGARCYNPCAGEYFLGASSRLSNDTLYREFTYTVAQIVGFFGFDNCPPEVQQMWYHGGRSLDFEFVVAHSIEPNIPIASYRSSGQQSIRLVPSRFPWREVYWLKSNKTTYPMSRRGFREQPFFAIRWRATANDPYGRSPAMDCIGDNKQLQQETLRKNEYIEKLVRPPMVAPPEMKNEPASIMPGMITYANALNGQPLFKPAFEVNAQALQPMTMDIEKISGRIKEAFFVPVFMAITQMAGVQPRNELELTKRDLERLQALGPFITLFENEAATPAVMRYLAIGERKGIIRPRPQSLRRLPIKISYESIIRQAQKAALTVSYKDFATTVGVATNAAKLAGAPAPARKVNWDKYVTKYGEYSGMDKDVFFSDDEVKQHDQIRLEEQKNAQQAQAAPGAAKATADMAKTLSQTQLPNGTALDALLGHGAFPAAG
jgi:hypothetical protein